MKVFQVRQGSSGAILWTGAAGGELQALDAMAHEAGYYDHADLPDSIRSGGLSVEALTFGASAARIEHRTMQGGRAGQVLERGRSGGRPGDRTIAANG